MKKLLLSAIFATFCFAAAQAQQFGDWELVCWDSAGVTVPLQMRVSTANSSGALIRTYYRFTPGALAKCVPTVGTIGACGSSQLAQIVVSMSQTLIDNDTLIASLQQSLEDNDTIIANLQQSLEDNDTIIANLQQSLVDNDTIISNLEIIANAQSGAVATEPGCLTLSAQSCEFTGLGASPFSPPPPLGGVVYFNLSYLGTMTAPGSCTNIANFMNANDPNDGSWACCADTLIVNSLDTSDYQQININWFGNNDANTVYNFNDTIGPSNFTSTIPVEIVKVMDAAGNVDTVRVFSADGLTEYTDLSGLSTGPCATEEEVVFNAYVTVQMDSLIGLLGGDCTLSDEVRLQNITANTTYPANTLNSISIVAQSGTVTVNTGGSGAVTIAAGAEYWFGAEGCSYLQTEIVVNITAGAAHVSRYY